MQVIVEARLSLKKAANEKVVELLADAFHGLELDGSVYDVSVGACLADGVLEVTFGLANVGEQTLKALVPRVEKLVLRALSTAARSLPDSVEIPAAHLIDAMAFKPTLTDHSS